MPSLTTTYRHDYITPQTNRYNFLEKPLNETNPGQDVCHDSVEKKRQHGISNMGEKCESWKWTAPAPAGKMKMPHMWREAPLVPKLEKVNRCCLDQPNRFLKTISNTYPALHDRLKNIPQDELQRGNRANGTTTYHVDYGHMNEQPGGFYSQPNKIQDDDNRFYSVRMKEPCNMFDVTAYKVKCSFPRSGGQETDNVDRKVNSPFRTAVGDQMQWRSSTSHWDSNRFERHPNLTQYMDTMGRTALIVQENKLHDHSQCRGGRSCKHSIKSREPKGLKLLSKRQV